jgi:hypothetical protein
MSRAKCYARLRPSAIAQWEQGKRTFFDGRPDVPADALLPNIVRSRTILHGQAYFGPFRQSTSNTGPTIFLDADKLATDSISLRKYR